MEINLPKDKLYFSIGEVARAFKISTAALRQWEDSFETLKPKKNKNGDRVYSWDDINNVGVIYSLLKEQGFKIKGAAKKLGEDKTKIKDIKNRNEALRLLKELKERLEILRSSI